MSPPAFLIKHTNVCLPEDVYLILGYTSSVKPLASQAPLTVTVVILIHLLIVIPSLMLDAPILP